VVTAYGIKGFQLAAPDWMEDSQFNVSAKVPVGATMEQFRFMMQNMLAERFKLAVHFEKKEMQRYDLVIAKGGPKLKESAMPPPKEDAAEQKRVVAPELKLGADGYPALAEGMTVAMMNGRARIMYPRRTMEFFAGKLASQLDHPVVDLTGLTGKYDFALFLGRS